MKIFLRKVIKIFQFDTCRATALCQLELETGGVDKGKEEENYFKFHILNIIYYEFSLTC